LDGMLALGPSEKYMIQNTNSRYKVVAKTIAGIIIKYIRNRKKNEDIRLESNHQTHTFIVQIFKENLHFTGLRATAQCTCYDDINVI